MGTVGKPPIGSTSRYTVTANKSISGSTTSQTVTAAGSNSNIHYTLCAKDGVLSDRAIATWTNKSNSSGNAKKNEKTYIKATGYSGGSRFVSNGTISY